jgi:hypothetical protein
MQRKGMPFKGAIASPKSQETDSHHSVMAKSENSGRIFERGGFAGRTERGDKFMCTVRLKLINFINAKSKLQQETSKPI